MRFEDKLPEGIQDKLLREYRKSKCNEIRNKIVLNNLKLVQYIANRYTSPSLDKDDLFQEGIIGLIQAVEGYKEEKGPFGSYASLHINGSIIRAMTNKSRIIRIPAYMVERLTRFKKDLESLEEEYGRELTTKEIAKVLNEPIAKIEEIQSLFKEIKSLDENILGDGESITLIEVLVDNKTNVENEAIENVYAEEVQNKMKTILKDDKIINLYFGIGCKIHTAEEISKKYNIPIDYIHNKRDGVLRKLRHARNIEKEVDAMTSFVKSIDYTQPRVSQGSIISSPVERIILEREKIRNYKKRRIKK